MLRLAPAQEVVVTDIAGHWAAQWIAAVARSGVIEPFANHTFQPASPVTRADLAGAVSRVVTLAASRQPELRSLLTARPAIADMSAGHLSYPAVSVAVASGVMPLSSGGRFEVALVPVEGGAAYGLEQVEFRVAGLAGNEARPLAKVVSGGELSRISLAIQLVAAKASPVGSLVFDEIDSGIGGAVAETIGKSLRKLGRERQVLCVTHLPQVAANGNEQWSVTRSGVKVKAAKLDRSQRIAEVARMLGGAESTARKHAAELLDAS